MDLRVAIFVGNSNKFLTANFYNIVMIATLTLTLVIFLIITAIVSCTKAKKMKGELSAPNVNPHSSVNSIISDSFNDTDESSKINNTDEDKNHISASENKDESSWIERNIWWIAVGAAIFLLRMCSDLMPRQ